MINWKIISIISIIILIVGFLFNTDSVGDLFLPDIPNVTLKDVWGHRNINDTHVTEIIIKVPEETLNNLHERIKSRKLAPSFSNSNFQYGFNVDYADSLMEYWLHKYQWRQWESTINQFQHYFTTIKGLQIHFIHIKPIIKSNQKLIPILLLHGWPGSFFEFYKLIPLLSESMGKEQYAFEIICPSLVGFGWSDGANSPGFDAFAMSDIMFSLMERLNITSKFYIQGGDFGSLIAGSMASINSNKIAGIHINLIQIPIHDWRYMMRILVGSLLPTRLHFLTPKELEMIYPWTVKMKSLVNQMGYFWLQATRPSTVGIALSDSPTGLATYILEKFGAWTNNQTYHLNSSNGGLEGIKISKDEMLTNVMIYYITNSISSSIRLYKEIMTDSNRILFDNPIHVPTGIASFPNEITQAPRLLAQIKYRDIRQFTHMPSGGHFAALEEPELLANDIKSFVKLVENH